jgi:hypothetical protein
MPITAPSAAHRWPQPVLDHDRLSEMLFCCCILGSRVFVQEGDARWSGVARPHLPIPATTEPVLSARPSILVLTGGPEFFARLTWIKLRRLCLVRGRENVPRITFVKLAPGTAFVGFPTSFTPPQILGGVKLRRGDIVVHSLGGQTSGASRWGFIAVAQEDLAFYGRPLIGVNLVPPPAMSNLRSPSAAPARLSLLHAQACRVAEAKPEIIVHREVERALEDDLPQRAPSAA